LTILHIDTGREMRGGQWQALYLMMGLAARGHQVRLLTPGGSPLFQEAQNRGLDVRALKPQSIAPACAGVDLIHAHDARAHTLGLLGRWPLVVSRRVAFPVRRGPGSRLKYAAARHYVAVSSYVKNVLLDAGITEEKISVVSDGVPIAEASSAFGQRSGVITLDSTDPKKGRKLMEQASQLAGVPLCFSNDLPRDLVSAAIFVYITELEGLGSAALLAMAAGAAVLASRVGGLPEVIEDGVCGLLTDNDPERIAAGMLRLLHDPAFAAKLAAQGRSRVAERFSVDKMVTETIRVYERILS